MVDEEDTDDFREIFLVMDLMDSDLQKVIVNREEKLDDAHIQWLVYQLLCGFPNPNPTSKPNP